MLTNWWTSYRTVILDTDQTKASMAGNPNTWTLEEQQINAEMEEQIADHIRQHFNAVSLRAQIYGRAREPQPPNQAYIDAYVGSLDSMIAQIPDRDINRSRRLDEPD